MRDHACAVWFALVMCLPFVPVDATILDQHMWHAYQQGF